MREWVAARNQGDGKDWEVDPIPDVVLPFMLPVDLLSNIKLIIHWQMKLLIFSLNRIWTVQVHYCIFLIQDSVFFRRLNSMSRNCENKQINLYDLVRNIDFGNDVRNVCLCKECLRIKCYTKYSHKDFIRHQKVLVISTKSNDSIPL